MNQPLPTLTRTRMFLTTARPCSSIRLDEMKTAINKMQEPKWVGGYTSQETRHSLCIGLAGLSS